jgi:hypothetical protein
VRVHRGAPPARATITSMRLLLKLLVLRQVLVLWKALARLLRYLR